MDFMKVLWAVIWFAVLGLGLGIVLALASRLLAVKTDERVEKIKNVLPGANCGGCGYAGCVALAQAVVDGKAEPGVCNAAENKTLETISEIMGASTVKKAKLRAQVLCRGHCDSSKKKYVYEGAPDCVSAVRLGGGDRECPVGCLGLGSCVSACKFDAIEIIDGVAHIDSEKCRGCGVCTSVCPKGIIELVPCNAVCWVGCSAVEKGITVRKYCDNGCISCKLCEKNCEFGAIKVNGFGAKIDYELCTGCGKCVEVCTRNVIECIK